MPGLQPFGSPKHGSCPEILVTTHEDSSWSVCTRVEEVDPDLPSSSSNISPSFHGFRNLVWMFGSSRTWVVFQGSYFLWNKTLLLLSLVGAACKINPDKLSFFAIIISCARVWGLGLCVEAEQPCDWLQQIVFYEKTFPIANVQNVYNRQLSDS